MKVACIGNMNNIISPTAQYLAKMGHEVDLFLLYEYDHFETGILLRKNNKKANNLSDQIYSELVNHSIRDQISTPYAVWKAREAGDKGILTIQESFTAHKGQLNIPKSQVFFTEPKPSEKLKEDLNKR